MKTVVVSLALLLSLSAVGCVKGVKPYEGKSKNTRTIFLPSNRSEGEAPVYARTRWVHPPEVLPARSVTEDTSRSDIPTIQPVFQLSMKNATLEQTAHSLASMARYSSYVSPSLASLKFSFENLGTIDELGAIIEEKALIKVIIDHQNKEVRFLMRSAAEPTLYSE
jgi:hypothetical protein